MTRVPQVLFVCVHNAGRSQMAAALLERHAGGRVAARSGGSTPAEQIHPGVRDAMAEVGIDLSAAVPAPWTPEDLGSADVVVTMGCGDACPVHAGKRTSTGSSRTQPGSRCTKSVRSATRSTGASERCSPSCSTASQDDGSQLRGSRSARKGRSSMGHAFPRRRCGHRAAHTVAALGRTPP